MTAPLTLSQHTVLARLSDGEWRAGLSLTTSGSVLGALYRKGYIRHGIDGTGYLDEIWTITTDGIAALEAVT